MIKREKEWLTDGRPDGRMLQSVLNEHAAWAREMNALHDAYLMRDTPISRRRMPDGLPDHRLTHAYAHYIVAVASAYLGHADYFGEGRMPAAILNAYKKSDIGSVDMELMRWQSLMGKGVELTYVDERLQPRSCVLDPRQAFVVYDCSAACRPLFGVYVREVTDEKGEPCAFRMEVYTECEILTYEAKDFAQLGRVNPIRAEHHVFGRVPLIEYWNNDEERGDFEPVLPLLNAYDTLQSDRVNDMEQQVNALLIIYGAELLPDENGRTPAQQLRQDKLLYLPDKDAGAQYLTRGAAGQDAETLRRALNEDIHKFSMIPDLTDQAFAGNTSGVAIRYKLLGLEQLTAVKERWFRQGLRERLRAYASFLELMGETPCDTDQIRIEFERSLPQNLPETAQAIKMLEGIVPNEELRAQLPFARKD